MAILKLLSNPFMTVAFLVMMGIGLSGCSGESFHLRGSQALPEVYQRIFLQGDSFDSSFAKVLRKKLDEVGSELVENVDKATAIIQLNQYKEGKRVAAYGPNREVSEFLIYIRFEFETKSAKTSRVLIPTNKINLDKAQIYDSAFVLGKIEEERLIKADLRNNAARQVVLRLQYGS